MTNNFFSGLLDSFKQGGMKDESDLSIANEIVGGKGCVQDGFDSLIRGSVTTMLLEFAVPWFRSCIMKYTEEEFHAKLAEGFDFHDDWLANHAERYGKFIRKGRKAVRLGFFQYDSDRILTKVLKLLLREGWIVYPYEQERIRKAIEDVKHDLMA